MFKKTKRVLAAVMAIAMMSSVMMFNVSAAPKDIKAVKYSGMWGSNVNNNKTPNLDFAERVVTNYTSWYLNWVYAKDFVIELDGEYAVSSIKFPQWNQTYNSAGIDGGLLGIGIDVYVTNDLSDRGAVVATYTVDVEDDLVYNKTHRANVHLKDIELAEPATGKYVVLDFAKTKGGMAFIVWEYAPVVKGEVPAVVEVEATEAPVVEKDDDDDAIVDNDVDDADDDTAVAASDELVVTVTIGDNNLMKNGEAIVMDVAPFISEVGRTMVPLRAISEAFGADVDYDFDGDPKYVSVALGDIEFNINIDEEVFDDEGVLLGSAVVTDAGRTFVPFRYIAAKLGASVDWDAATQTVKIVK